MGRMLAAAARWPGVLVALVGVGCASLPEGRPELVVAGFEEVGVLPAPEGVLRREGAVSSVVGDGLLWAFGWAELAGPAADGREVRVNSAALAPVHDPLRTTEARDARGAPLPLIALARAERAFEERGEAARVRLDPTGVVRVTPGRHYVVYRKGYAEAGADRVGVESVGVARVEAGQTVAFREGEALFAPPGPLLWNPMADGNWVYFYGPVGEWRAGGVGVARVRRYRLTEREAYEYWDGAGWVREGTSAAVVLRGVPGDMSVAYNRHLRRYLAVYSEAGSSRMVLRTAERAEGPFGRAVVVDLARGEREGGGDGGGEGGVVGLARQHPELVSADGRRIAVTFYRTQRGAGGEVRGEVVLAWVWLGEE